ncbi:hypothetical protein [Maribacter sp. 2307UL18-2]|uniref:hypothetical protein n=1 Tax=Maribacter sp. 2307UL18-2 TaxID=3386274 RepID=UPI0039BD58A1
MKQNWNKITRGLLWYLLLMCVEIIVIVSVFIYFFKDQEVSNNIADWGSFGDFIGGVLNPLIAFFSLILLGTITWLLGKRNEDSSLELNLRLKKIDAYELIVKQVSAVHDFHNVLFNYALLMKSIGKSKATRLQIVELLQGKAKEMNQITAQCGKVRTIIESYSYRFSHLFRRNLKDLKFDDLVDKVRVYVEICERMNVVAQHIGLNDSEDDRLTQEFNELAEEMMGLRSEFLESYMTFAYELRKELS